MQISHGDRKVSLQQIRLLSKYGHVVYYVQCGYNLSRVKIFFMRLNALIVIEESDRLLGLRGYRMIT